MKLLRQEQRSHNITEFWLIDADGYYMMIAATHELLANRVGRHYIAQELRALRKQICATRLTRND